MPRRREEAPEEEDEPERPKTKEFVEQHYDAETGVQEVRGGGVGGLAGGLAAADEGQQQLQCARR